MKRTLNTDFSAGMMLASSPQKCGGQALNHLSTAFGRKVYRPPVKDERDDSQSTFRFFTLRTTTFGGKSRITAPKFVRTSDHQMEIWTESHSMSA